MSKMTRESLLTSLVIDGGSRKFNSSELSEAIALLLSMIGLVTVRTELSVRIGERHHNITDASGQLVTRIFLSPRYEVTITAVSEDGDQLT